MYVPVRDKDSFFASFMTDFFKCRQELTTRKSSVQYFCVVVGDAVHGAGNKKHSEKKGKNETEL